MLKQIVRLSIHQTSKIVALIHFIISIIFIIPLTLITYIISQDPAFFVYLIFPFVYFVISYIITAIFCWLYNLIAKGFGGIEFELQDPRGHHDPGTEV